MPEDVPVKGRNKSIIVVSIKILDTAAFRRCQMRQQGSGCENFITVLLFQEIISPVKLRFRIKYRIDDGHAVAGFDLVEPSGRLSES